MDYYTFHPMKGGLFFNEDGNQAILNLNQNEAGKREKQHSEPGTKKIAIPTMQRLIRTTYRLVKYNQDYDYAKAKV